MTFDRPPREKYIRASVERGGFTCEPAVEYRDGDDFYTIAAKLRALFTTQLFGPVHAMYIAELFSAQITLLWPGRAYFVEVWEDGRDGFAQIFQPFGVPRNDLASLAAEVANAGVQPDALPVRRQCECDRHEGSKCSLTPGSIVERDGKRLLVCHRCELTGDTRITFLDEYSR